MKKLGIFVMSLAMAAFAFTSCNGNKGGTNLDNVVEDGFYVYGPATAVADMKADNAALGLMGAGINEATKKARKGLYEKYVALEGGKEFTLALYEKQKATEYGAKLELGDPYDVAYGVTIQVYKGKLEQNVKMTVPKSGFYHIALDLNVENDLPEPCIIVAPVEWEVGADPEKKMTASEFNKTSMSWELKDIEMKKGSNYKFAYGNGWKIKVTPAQDINIETNLGEGMKSGGSDIVITKSGKYTFKLVWTLAGGAIEKNFKNETACTEEYQEKAPDAVYMIGEFCSWKWENCFPMVRVHSGDAFWAIMNLKANEGFKFNTVKDWNGGDFTKLVQGVEGATEKDGNLIVAEDGLYLIYVDYATDKVTVQPARVYGLGDAFGGWDNGVAFEAKDGKFEGVTTAAGNLRMFADADIMEGIDWWKREFNIYGGKIVYRADGGDQEAVPVQAGQKITLDFNAGTGTIQ